MMRSRLLFLLLLGTSLTPLFLNDALGVDIGSSIQQCRTVKDIGERVKCYDAMSIPAPETKIEPIKSIEKPKTNWSKDPDSLMSIKLGQPIEASVSAACPTKTSPYGWTDMDTLTWSRQGRPRCYERHGKVSATIYGHGVDRAGLLAAYMDDAGLVAKVTTFFLASSAGYFQQVLFERFGPPTVTKADALLLNSGASLPKEVSTWDGDAIILTLDTLDNRVVSDGITDYGKIMLVRKDFLAKENEKSEQKMKDAASKL